MTQKQIDAARATLPSLCSVPWQNWTLEQKTLSVELDCRNMINSCLVYEGIKHGIALFYEEHPSGFFTESYAKRYICIIGADRVKELVDEQVKDFENATVFPNVSVDSENVVYNSVKWGDE